ncbi:MAG TPA: zinc ribbon domain-containing protein, partial [Methanoregula sp.]|nr:zinc ribbon domain-containing protein [Methanoregula sp.]
MTVPARKTCPACGTSNRPDCRFCTGCGKEFEKERICSRCNAPLTGSQRFCNSCGAPADSGTDAKTGGQMKFCRQCRALISRDAKFCGTCGTVISELPVCPRCGDPIGPEEKFCGACGMSFAGIVPARQPVQPAAPIPPQTAREPIRSPAPAKKGGGSLVKIVAGIVIVIVILAVIILLLPDPENPPPPSTGGSATAGITIPDGEDKVATQKSIDASNAVVLKASNALAQGDTAGFTSVLVSDLKTALSGTTLNPASAKTVADSLK